MKYLQATFKNYIGFYNGMGLYEVTIDFRKCMHNIIIISGKNGSGKSTLLNHLNPFPDPSTSFITNRTAEKQLVLADNGDIYTIQIVSPADLKGRKTTKAYIQKNGVELNSNGNVSSYKEIIFSEFELDSNYISLTRLSNNDRGLGDKTPAERKRFAANIVDNLEIYNSMYKTLNKKSLIYRSHTNTLHTKIQNIGNAENLKSRLNQLMVAEDRIRSDIMLSNNTIVHIKAKSSIDNEEAEKINVLYAERNMIMATLSPLETQLDSFFHKTKIAIEDISSVVEKDKELLQNYMYQLNQAKDKWKSESEKLADIENNINAIKADLDYNISESDIADRFNKSQATIEEILTTLNGLGIDRNTDVLELEKVIAFCERFSILIDKFNSSVNSGDLDYIINKYDSVILSDIINEQNRILMEIESNRVLLSESTAKLKLISVLHDRPKECKVDSCPFISEALSLSSKINGNIEDEIASIIEANDRLSKEVDSIQERIDYHNAMHYKKIELDNIRSEIYEIRDILMKYYPKFVENFNILVLNMNNFGYIREHKLVTDGANLLKMLASETQKNSILEVEYRSYNEKVKLLNSSRVMLSNLEKSMVETVENIKIYKSEVDKLAEIVESTERKVNSELEYHKIYLRYKEEKSKYDVVADKLLEFEKKSAKCMEDMKTISQHEENIAKLNVELEPIIREKNNISGQLTMLESYYDEYNKYKQSYDIIETLKKYCSPTSGGIQTLFMQLYMGKTKELANTVLAMLFNGSYQLCDFVINENEFRIPFIGEGLPVDDISSGSGAQIAMMGMIINLVLMCQASTKFNIARLDEVTATLDAYNNSQFTNVMLHCMNILKIEQLFLISHSTETDNSFADVIKLKGYENYESAFQSGNVIWDFNEVVKQ